jgi:hypothetical protein
MEKAFERIALIDSIIASALVSPTGELLGWCANSAIPSEKLSYVATSFQQIFGEMQEGCPTDNAVVSFGEHSLIARKLNIGVLIIYLDSQVTEAVLEWLWTQIDPLLTQAA